MFSPAFELWLVVLVAYLPKLVACLLIVCCISVLLALKVAKLPLRPYFRKTVLESFAFCMLFDCIATVLRVALYLISCRLLETHAAFFGGAGAWLHAFAYLPVLAILAACACCTYACIARIMLLGVDIAAKQKRSFACTVALMNAPYFLIIPVTALSFFLTRH